MDVETIQAEIRNELMIINQILGVIQSELDDLNTLSKPEGILDVAVREGLLSANALTKLNGFSLEAEVKKMSNLKNNRPMDATMADSRMSVMSQADETDTILHTINDTS